MLMLDLAESAGIDGIVCSPHELELVKKETHYYQLLLALEFKIQMMIKKEL